MPAYAPQDRNQVSGVTLWSGTAGTADTAGTSQLHGWSGNPLTGAAFVELANGGVSSSPVKTYGTIFAATAAAYGTLIGSATLHYITSIKAMNNEAGTVDIMIGWGTALNGTTVIDRGKYTANSGVVRNFIPPLPSVVGADLVCWAGAAGTLAINISYL